MRRFSIAAALAALAIAVPLGIGSSHREAPLTALDPTGDDTDVYAFTAKDDPATGRNEEKQLTVVANWIPFEDPAGGPNFYRFDDRAHYYINVDNDGDGRYDVRYRFEFDTDTRDENTYLYAKPEVTSINDPDLNVVQTYDVVREERGDDGRDDEDRDDDRDDDDRDDDDRDDDENGDGDGRTRIANDLPTAPNYAGEKTIPNYTQVANQAIKDLRTEGGVGKVFAGQRDDPFFIDLEVPFDAFNFRLDLGAQGGGKDDVAGYAVHSIVMQIPEEDLTRDGRKVAGPNDEDAVVGVWASTERQELQVTNRDTEGEGDFVQVSRLGNPLVNEVVIPRGQKDRFNRHSPEGDADRFGGFVVNPEVARLMNLLFPSLNVKETNRTDIVLALLQGFPGLNRQSGKPVDTLKINLATPPSATEGRFGLLPNAATGFPDGDPAGFPNGRRLGDDILDIEVRVIAGALLPTSDPQRNTTPLGDGVDRNDKPFLSRFPYVAEPDSANDSSLKRIEGTHGTE